LDRAFEEIRRLFQQPIEPGEFAKDVKPALGGGPIFLPEAERFLEVHDAPADDELAATAARKSRTSSAGDIGTLDIFVDVRVQVDRGHPDKRARPLVARYAGLRWQRAVAAVC
jgi:hypothetical protein